MNDTKAAWDEVAKRAEGLGLKLKLHLEQAHDDDEAAVAKPRLEAALSHLGDALDDAFEALGNAARDPAVKDDLLGVGSLLRDALSSTFSDAGDEFRRAFRRQSD